MGRVTKAEIYIIFNYRRSLAVEVRILFFQNHFASTQQINIKVTYQQTFLNIRNITFLQRIIKMFFKIRFVRRSIQHSYQNWLGPGQENVSKNVFNVTTETYLMIIRQGLSNITCNPSFLLERSSLIRSYSTMSNSLLKIDESSLACHEQVCLSGLRLWEKYLSKCSPLKHTCS